MSDAIEHLVIENAILKHQIATGLVFNDSQIEDIHDSVFLKEGLKEAQLNVPLKEAIEFMALRHGLKLDIPKATTPEVVAPTTIPAPVVIPPTPEAIPIGDPRPPTLEEAMASVAPPDDSEILELEDFAESLLGVDLVFDDIEKKTIRMAYKKLTNSRSQDEVADFKTLMAVLSESPEDLEGPLRDIVLKLMRTPNV